MFKYIFLILGFILCTNSVHAKTVFIVPLCSLVEPFYQTRVDVSDSNIVYFRLREALENAGYNVEFVDIVPKKCTDLTAVLVFNHNYPKLLESLTNYSKEKSFLFVYEPPLIMPQLYDRKLTRYFGKIFVMMDNIIDNKNYYKFHYPQPRLKIIESLKDFNEKKLCVLIATNVPKIIKAPRLNSIPCCLYPERFKFINFFENLETDEFDLYGSGWEGCRNWKGRVSDKWVVLNNYKFCICYENMKDQVGYITEKIFDCFNGGCVPVYWGASNITDYIPKECFIDRRNFSSEVKIYDYLKSMDRSTYERYLSAIKNYLESPQAQVFSGDYFISNVLNHLSHL